MVPPKDPIHGGPALGSDVRAERIDDANRTAASPSSCIDYREHYSAVLLCGPMPLINDVCKPALRRIGFDEDQLFVFS